MVTFCNFLRLRKKMQTKSVLLAQKKPNYFPSTEATRVVHKGFDVLILHKCRILWRRLSLIAIFLVPATHSILTMLAKNSLSLARRRLSKTVQWQAVRAQSTESNSPIAQDGRHEVWREGIYDHDNEPK